MEPPEHLLTFVSIIIGLAFTRLLDSLGKAIEHRSEIKEHFVLLYAWALSVFPAMMQLWWGMWEFRAELIQNSGFRYSLLLVAMPTTWFFLTELLFPDDLQRFEAKFKASQREWYYSQKRWLFLISALIILLYAINGALILEQGFSSPLQQVRFVVACVYIILAFESIAISRRKDIVHWVGWLINISMLVLYLVLDKRYSALASQQE